VVRFIEYMDVGTTNGWRLDHVLTAEEILSVVRTRTGLEPIAPDRPGEVASRYRRIDGGGEIGVIASVSRPFCRDCVRARLSSDGRLHTCLFSTGGTALGYALRHGVPDSQIASMIRSAWHLRDDRYSELRSDATRPSAAVPVTLAGSAERAGRPTPAPGAEKVEMSYIGG
jgi:cyclic pyranopterin phosphate synthase